MAQLSNLLAGQSNIVTDQDLATVATTGSYTDLTNKPAIPSIAGLATTAELASYATLTGTQTLTNKTINFANNTLTGVLGTQNVGSAPNQIPLNQMLGSAAYVDIEQVITQWSTSGANISYTAGNVGIRTTTLSSITGAAATLSLGGTSTSTSGGVAYQVNGTPKAYHYVDNDLLYHQALAGVSQVFWTNNTERFRIASAGQIGLSGANYGTTGQVLTSQGPNAAPIWAAGGGGGSAAGSTGFVQFNNAGAFTADGGFFWDNTNKRLSINSGSTPTEALVLGGRIRMGSTGYILADNNGSRQFFISTTGNDTTGDGSNANPWATLGRALSACAMFMPSAHINNEIILKNGTYNLSSVQYIRGFSGGGRLTIRAETAGSVTVNLNGGASFEIERNDVEIFFAGITFQTDSFPGMFNIVDTLRVRFQSNCAINQMISSGRNDAFNQAIGVSNSRFELECPLTVVNQSFYGAVINIYSGSIYYITGVISKSGSRHGNAAVSVQGNSDGSFHSTINNFNIGINMGQSHYDAEQCGIALANNLSITNCNIGIRLTNNGSFKNYYTASFSGTTTPVFFVNGWYSGTASSEYNLIGYNTSVNSAYRLQVNSQIYATSSTIATSDGRYKKNVANIENALDIITALRPVQFDWIPHDIHNFDTEHTTVGFIAQEVKEVLEGTAYADSIIKSHYITREAEEYETVVVTPATQEVIDENGNLISLAAPPVTEKVITKPAVVEEFFGIAEGNLISILTSAVQELKVMVDAQAAEIAALKGQL
jgi:hypothetical protein